MRVRVLLLLTFGACAMPAPAPEAALTLRGRVVTQGPCRVGLADVPVHVVWPSLSSAQRQSNSTVSAADGTFTAEVPDGGFDLVVIAPKEPLVFVGLSGPDFQEAPNNPGGNLVLVETGETGPLPMTLKTFTVTTTSESCVGPAPHRAGFSNATPEELRLSLDRSGSGPFTGTISACPVCSDCAEGGATIPLSLDVETTDECQVMISNWLLPTTNHLPLPLPATLPEMTVWIGPRATSMRSLRLPSTGLVKVKAVTAFGTRELPVSATGTFQAPAATTLEASVSSADGLATLTIRTSGGDPLELPAIPRAVTPLDGFAALKPGTEFTWTRTVVGAQLLTIEPSGHGGPTIRIFTDATSVTLPDLSAFGVSLEPAAQYTWTVFTPGGFSSSVGRVLLERYGKPRSQLTFTSDTITGSRQIRTP